MRAYFKNDLYNFAAHRDREKEAQKQKLESERLAQLRDKAAETKKQVNKTRPKQNQQVDDSLTITLQKKENHQQIQNTEDLAELMRSFKKKTPDQQSEKKTTLPSTSFMPKSTLVIKEEVKDAKKTDAEERKERKQQNIQYKKMQDELKRIIKPEGQNKEATEGESKSESEESKPEEAKTKKIKKQANYQRLDLKRKYKDRFIGGLNANLRRFTRNGRLRPKYRAQAELGIEDGEVYNSYIASLSKSLKLTLTLQDSDEEEQEEAPPGPKWTPPADPTNRQQLTQSLKEYFGFQHFREGQFETIQNVMGGKSTLFISETASGKSLTYILSAMLMGGFSMVVSPLVSLMLDQLQHLPLELAAACVSSLLNKEQQRHIAELVKKGSINILFLTPEALQTDFLYHLQDFPPANFVCVDEAHSLSQLSHNFRTSFLTLADIIMSTVRYKAAHPVILGLTATANPQTVRSVADKLSIGEVVRSSSCMNKNLYITISRQKGQLKYQSLIRYLNDPLILDCKGILVYTRTRKIMDQVFNYITNSVPAKAAIYHGALSSKQKTETLEKFRQGSIRIVVATVALGMGLDFQHLECVVHLNMPKSIENYVQEIGRAGRRQRRAYCHLFLDQNDYITQRNYIIADEIEPSLLAMIYQLLRDNSVVKQPKEKPTSQEVRRLKEELVIKRAAILMEQCLRQEQIIYEEDQEQLDSDQEPPQPSAPRLNSQLFSLRIDKLVEKTQLKEEAILTLILKIEYLLREDEEVRFRVLPTAHERLKIGFFKQNEAEVRSSSPFFRQLVEGCPKVKGCIHVPLIDKCNQLGLRPVQALSQLYRLKDQYFLRIDEENPIFVWQFEGRKVELDGGIDYELGQLVERGFDRLMGSQFIEQVVEEMREVQSTSLVKLNVLWSLGFLHSRNHITNVLQGRLLPRNQPIPPKTLPADLDDYFKCGLHDFYQRITNNGTEIYIPTSTLDKKEVGDVYECIALFFKHEISNEGQLRANEVPEARRRAIEKYQNGKVIAKILLGVSSGDVSWKIYGERSYWMAFKHKNYAELLQVVREQIQRYKEEHRQ